MHTSRATRRDLLRSLAAAPVLAGLSPLSLLAAEAEPLITAAEQALDVFDFERVARSLLPPAHYGYLATGVDGDATLRANSEAFAHYAVRARRMRDIRNLDLSVEVFGKRWDSPLYLNPIGSQRAFHAEGELAVARAAKAGGHVQILSTVTSTAVEEVTAARGAPVWYQLYPTDQWPVTQALMKRAEAAGCPVLVLTVDLQAGSNRVTSRRAIRQDARDCSTCHADSASGLRGYMARKPMFAGTDLSAVTAMTPFDMSWAYFDRVREAWPHTLVIKGLVEREDAEQAIEHGADGVIVSNHGGRAEDSGRATIDCLAEVVAGVRGRAPVLVDSGFRRGSDVLKALALGATAVGIGRPYIWGLAAFGEAGVAKVLEILRNELRIAMGHAGARTLAELTPATLIDTRRG